MAKSSQTFKKKELEKKRLQKQNEKREKRQERKTSSDKGKSLDEMMAYVDEYGNITSTPPDPSRKKKINVEDIEIGVARREDTEEEVLRTGIVTFFNEAKGFGFIRDLQSQESIFVHINSLNAPLKESDKVTFETERGLKGLNAIKVKKAEPTA